jgi:hypothetical protein
MRRTLLLLAAVAALALPAAAAADDGPDAVIQYNRTLLRILRTPGRQPATIHPTRSMAMVHLAIADAVARAERGHDDLPDGRGTAGAAAAAVAGHDVLGALFGAEQPALDQQEQALLAALPSGRAADRGRRAGAAAAAAELADRAGDGADVVPPPYVPTGAPGDFAPTPPDFAAPVFTHWAAVRPFALDDGAQFRPPPPPSLSSERYARAVAEVRSLGQDSSATRTADETTVARFWAAPIQNYWNEIAQSVALEHHLSLEQDAELFGALDGTIADGVIAFYDAKYAYRLWRPIDAIRRADTDGNPDTVADPAWTPLAKTPADPSYPGAHSVVSAAAATVLGELLGDRPQLTVTSEVLPGVTRSFDSLHDVVEEAGRSRILAGVHTRLDDRAGRRLGRAVAGHDLERLLR